MGKIIPQNMDGISPAWLADTLSHSPLHPDGLQAADISNFRVSTIGDDLGFTSYVCRVRYEVSGVSQSIVVKIANGNSPSLAAGYETEAAFYQRQLSRGTDGQLFRSPKVFAAEKSEDHTHFLLVLEDMGAPYEVADQLGGMDYQAAEAAVRALAGMHAQFWHCHPDHKDKPRPHGDQAVEGIISAKCLMAMCGTFPVTAMWASAREYITAESIRVPASGGRADIGPDSVVEVMDRVTAQFSQVAGEHWAGDRVTLVHSDYRGDNIMTSHGAPGLPSCPIDYQAVHFGRPLMDLGYFMSSSLTVPMRRQHQEELLRVYHTQLLELGVREEWLSWEDCLEGFRRDLLFSALMPVMMAMRLNKDRCQTDPDKIELKGRRLDVNKAWLERGVAALIDNDTAKAVGAAWAV